ncbi:GNAT family N-acetyltransferase [Maricaulis sp.]|uniref:GNAT family N-acetyltransferase n=1 Tax=Maricaulis sp. TaxID=1486257 RepID=UPI003297720A
MTQTVLETDRLILRQPDLSDFEPLCELMGDETVTRFIGGVQDPAQVWRSLCGIVGHWELRGYGFFSVIEKGTGTWLGRVGPWYPHGWPQPEIGWSLNRLSWGQGYASEAGAACMDFVFDTLGWRDVVHLIDSDNTPSQRVAERLGSRNLGRRVEVAGFPGMEVDLWGQDAADWRARSRA